MKTLILLAIVLAAFRSLADDTNAIYQTNFPQLILKSKDSPEVTAFLSHFSQKPHIVHYGPGLGYEFKQEGIDLLISEPNVYHLAGEPDKVITSTNIFDTEDILCNIFLMSQGADGYAQYAGPLPCGLKFSMTRGDVERLLGTPDKLVTTDHSDGYFKKNLSIEYGTNSYSSNPKDLRIFCVVVD